MKIRELMTTDVETATLQENLRDVAQKMKDEDAGAIPVVDEDNKLVGILTDRDIVVRCIAEGKDPEETTVEDVLTENLETIEPDSEAEEAAQIMAQRQIRRLPVVEEEELIGIVSIGDIAIKEDGRRAGRALQQVSRGVKNDSRDGDSRRSGRSTSARGRDLEDIRSGRELRDEAEDREERLQAGGTRSMRSTSARANSGKDRNQGITNRGSKTEQVRQAKVAPSRADRQRSRRRAS